MRNTLSSVGNRFLILFNIWMAFVVLSILVLKFPHWPLSILQIINYELFLLIFIFSITLFSISKYNRYVFLNLAVFSFLYLSGFFILFTGSNYLIGIDHLQWNLWAYRKITISLFTCVMIVFVILEYVYYKLAVAFKYIIALFISIPFWFIYFNKFLTNKNYIFQNTENFYQIFLGISNINMIGIFFILIYGYHCFNRERPISRYINSLMLSLLFFLAIDTVDNYFNYLHKNLPWSHQLFLMINLFFIIYLLGMNIYYIESAFGKFYDNYLFAEKNYNMKLLKKKSVTEKYVILFNSYINDKFSRVLFAILMIFSFIFFIRIYPFGYEKITFLIIVFLFAGIGIYLNMLFHRRAKDN